MKPLLILLLLPMFAGAQVFKLRAYAVLTAAHTDTGFVTKSSRTVDFLTVINVPKEKIQMYGDGEDVYDIVKLGETVHDSTGTLTHLTCIDDKGKECEITLLEYSADKKKQCAMEGAVASLVIRYDTYLAMFYLKTTN